MQLYVTSIALMMMVFNRKAFAKYFEIVVVFLYVFKTQMAEIFNTLYEEITTKLWFLLYRMKSRKKKQSNHEKPL